MSEKWTVDWAALSMQGLIRLKNEDSMVTPEGSLPLVHTDTGVLQGSFYIYRKENTGNAPTVAAANASVRLAVFDGMGGEQDGEYASYLAADCMAGQNNGIQGEAPNTEPAENEKTENDPEPETVGTGSTEGTASEIYDLCRQMNSRIVRHAKKRRCHMGTTVAGLDFGSENITCFNVGDSRIYRLADGEFKQLSKDHVPPFSRIRSDCLTQYLGIPETDFMIEPEINSIAYKEGNLFLLCTDGLYKTLNDRRLAEILADDSSLEQKLGRMKELVLKRGAEDNATFILCRIRSTE